MNVSQSLLKAGLILGLRFPTLVLGKRRSNYCVSLVIVGGMFDGLRIASELSSIFTWVRITDESASCKILSIVWHSFMDSSMVFQYEGRYYPYSKEVCALPEVGCYQGD